VFAANPGSTHGYDVTDPNVVNPELGGRDALDRFAGAAHGAGLRVLLDIVPNHQAATEHNPAWRRALESHDPGWFDARWVGDHFEYRRFFDVGELVGVRVEEEWVFDATHALTLELLHAGVVDGLRVDHVDGLADPAQYLERLHDATDGAFVVVEKILGRDEALPPSWPVMGTTGYEAGNALTELLIDAAGRARLAESAGRPFSDVELESKRYVLDHLFQAEWARVAGLLDDPSLAPDVRDVTIALPVYREYDAASLRAVIGGEPAPELSVRWQQLTGAVMAKGHEDTAGYRYVALLAQNEVGGDPGATAYDAVPRFHVIARSYRALVSTSTHDTKRSEDVRARLCVLSERADTFERGLARWRALVAPAPDVTRRESRFVAQTLLGAWPLRDDELGEFRERIESYLEKALRETKQESNWLTPNVPHEQAVIDCARRTIDDDLLRQGFGALVDEVMFFGAINSLAILTWKLAMPGAVDVYRGCELWDFSLVDPDNRRPVDFDRRRALLARGGAPLLDDWRSGAIKQQVAAAGLRARRAHRKLFAHGEYVEVAHPETVFAFARRLDDQWVVAIAPRLATRVTSCGDWPVGKQTWGDERVFLPADAPVEWRDGIPLAEALADFPVALLLSTTTLRR
jgi:(1->4)-alpha-D-glucan 1-alpha-D-glucosylmutase